MGFCNALSKPDPLATEPPNDSCQQPLAPPLPSRGDGNHDDGSEGDLVQFLLDQLHGEGGGGSGSDDEGLDKDGELDDLMMPDVCGRSISCGSLSSDGWVRSTLDAISNVRDWMDKEEDECVQDIDAVSNMVDVAPKSVSPCAAPLTKESTNSAGLLPAPRPHWSNCRAKGHPSPSPSPIIRIPIPRLSREVLVESTATVADVKKQKIARYLEKRRRRLARGNSSITSKVMYEARRNIANKRKRVNGRFVSTSEFGQAPKRQR